MSFFPNIEAFSLRKKFLANIVFNSVQEAGGVHQNNYLAQSDG